jgi:hypothetical protein
MKIAVMVVLAALSGWFVRGIRFGDTPVPSPSPHATPVIVEAAPVAEPFLAIQRVPIDNGSVGRRNLFAYLVNERPVITNVIVDPFPILIATPVEISAAPTPTPLPFHYRYIGKFGPPHNPVAAFSRDGEVLTVRAGDRIGDFVLRAIGIESVEVDGADGLRRIPLAADL